MAVAIKPEQLRAVALNAQEYRAIVQALGRDPNDLELGIFGALWSEHCAYKTSKALLRQLPTEGPNVLQGPGENAGAVDIGDGLAVVFKIESHNHPSAIEPYQGAATGVGGILRDVFAMGARPLAILDALCFGPLDDGRSRHLFQRVVAGIGGYGNCFGCPTVGGEVVFDAGYRDNPIVNAMCVGLVSHDRLRRARADRPDDVVLLVGADTGRDGIQGATFAAVEMDERSASRRPAVQVGNPFLEKLLCEACLVLNRLDGVTAIQDLGAAGLTSAASELAYRGRRGIDLDVDRVSRREQGMSAYEVMLSESQERMLVLVRPGAEAAARARDEQRVGADDGRHPLVRRARSLRRHPGGGRGSGAQHRLYRRPPAGRHQLPQLRQPGSALDLRAAARECPGPGGCLPRLRASRRQRQRQPLQRDQRAQPPSDAGHRHGGPAR